MAKNALCIGINNYPGTGMDLRGCVNDAEDWARELGARGFKVDKLLDAQATKKAIADGFSKLIGNAIGGDVVVLTFSGHGTYQPDDSGDEADRLDEALCPYDIRDNGALTDDEISQLFAARKPGVKLVLISDSCHSGTVTRAAAQDPDATAAALPRFMPMGNWLPDARLPRAANGKPAASIPVVSGRSPLAGALSKSASDLLLAGCREGPNNFSYDAVLSGRPNGAFTYYALKVLKTLKPDATYAQWMAAVNPRYLPSMSYPQSPQIVGNSAARKGKIFS